MAKKIHTVESMRNAAFWAVTSSKPVEIGPYNEPKWLTCFYNRPDNQVQGTFDFSFNDTSVSHEEAAAILTRQKALMPKPKKDKKPKPEVVRLKDVMPTPKQAAKAAAKAAKKEQKLKKK